MARLLLFNGKDFEEVEIGESDIDRFHEKLECDCFDIAYRKIDGTYYDIFCDDEGLFKDDPTITAISSQGEVMLVGNLIFANHNNEGETTSLSDDDITRIKSSRVMAMLSSGRMINPVLCDY